MISYGKQYIDESDIKSVVKVLRGDWLTQGPSVEQFENDLKAYFGSKYVSAVSNGTAALHLAGLSLGWKSDDIILTSPITFLASANSIVFTGATPDFVDIDKNNYTIDPNKAEEKIKHYRSLGKKIKAIIAVDYAGYPCDWESLKVLQNKYDIQLVNDNCHAIGASYNGEKEYAVQYADIVTQSYHPVKNFTTGEGGAILTNNFELDEKIKELRTHGIVKSEKLIYAQSDPWYYEMHNLGYNYRITDMQCALGSNQLKKLNRFIHERRNIAEIYNQQFSSKEHINPPAVNSNIGHAYHLYPLKIDFKKQTLTKKEFYYKMKESGINLQVHYIPVHLQPFYKQNFNFVKGDFPIAEDFYLKVFSLPIFPSLKKKDLKYVIENILSFLQ